jgi:hypothetical protein
LVARDVEEDDMYAKVAFVFLGLSLLSSAQAFAQEGRITVTSLGVANAVTTFEIRTKTGSLPCRTPNNNSTTRCFTDNVRVRPDNTITTTAEKADLIATDVNAQAANVTATANGSSVTLSPNLGLSVFYLGVFPLGNPREVDTLNPNGLRDPYVFGFQLTGSSTTSGELADFNIGGPGGLDVNFDTTGYAAVSVLQLLRNDINTQTSFTSTVEGSLLLINGPGPSNDITVDFQDPGFTYSYFVTVPGAAIPELSTLQLAAAGFGVLGLAAHFRRRTNVHVV